MSIETTHDDQIASELLDLVILTELLKKHLLIVVSQYVSEFEKQAVFEYSQPFSWIDLSGFIKKKGDLNLELQLKQLLFNLELFIVKLYRLTEISKSHLKGTSLKKLRQTFGHRKSPDTLGNKERLVIFGGMTYDLNNFFVENIASDRKSSERINYSYSGYVDILLESYKDLFKNKVKSIDKIRQLNNGLIRKIFPKAINFKEILH